MLQTCAHSFMPLLVKLCDDLIPGKTSPEHPFLKGRKIIIIIQRCFSNCKLKLLRASFNQDRMSALMFENKIY